ncbi:hypothetical protein Leryth_022566 [Lithospermum erythrorhizon]|nr:hypothetical protein Leryth_022566 [Lithospermum erythrorhizon]
MEFLLGNMNDDSDCFLQEATRCPFLRNINEPTHLSFAASMAFPIPGHGAKGPIFEDGPNFNLAFRLFHGQNGIVPLSGRSLHRAEKSAPEPAPPQFNPLAAKAATISLSSFGSGGPFGFDAFSEMFKNKKGKSKSSNGGSKGGNSKHEALSNEWLQNGNCPIAKSYRAVSKVLPLVAKVIQSPPGINLKCPPVIVAARAALARTAFAKNLRPQPLPAKVLAIGALGMAANIPLGIWREHTKKFSPSWFAAVHAAVPFIAMLRKTILMPKSAMALTIAASILGQVIGSRAERYRLKAVSSQTVDTIGSSISECYKDAEGIQGGHAEEMVSWNKVSLPVGEVSTAA